MTEVKVSQRALRDGWSDGEYEMPWLLLRTKNDPATAYAAAQAGLAAANADVDDQANPEGPPAWGGSLMSSPDGVMVELQESQDPDAVARWAQVFATAAGAAGVSGRLGPIRAEHSPFDSLAPGADAIAAVFALPVDYEAIEADLSGPRKAATGWYVAEKLTADLAAAAIEWCQLSGGDYYVAQDLNSIRVPREAFARTARQAIRRAPYVRLTCVRGTGQARYAALDPKGFVHFEQHDPARPWREAIDDLDSLLEDLGPAAEHAFIRKTLLPSIGMRAVLQGRAPKPPKVTPEYTRTARDLVPTHVPDAYGIQVLSEAHLQGGPDLEAWEVEDLGRGKFRVTAPDLAAWFSGDEPDPAVLAAARADFDPILLTIDQVHQHFRHKHPEYWPDTS